MPEVLTIDQIEKVWRQIEEVARPPYAQSWGWIENWLASLDHLPALAVITGDGGTPIAAAFEEQPVLRTPALPPLGCSGDDYRIVLDREIAVPHVDLEAARCVEGGYASMLPAPIRAHLRHARIHCEDLHVETATAAQPAHAVYDELLDLKGARDDAFYRRLIDQRAPAGEIQLLRVRADDTTVGCLFDITWHDHVVAQLAAFASASDADLCHAAAIEHDASLGFAFYELHPDDARLATGETRRTLLRFQRRVQHKLAG